MKPFLQTQRLVMIVIPLGCSVMRGQNDSSRSSLSPGKNSSNTVQVLYRLIVCLSRMGCFEMFNHLFLTASVITLLEWTLYRSMKAFLLMLAYLVVFLGHHIQFVDSDSRLSLLWSYFLAHGFDPTDLHIDTQDIGPLSFFNFHRSHDLRHIVNASQLKGPPLRVFTSCTWFCL